MNPMGREDKGGLSFENRSGQRLVSEIARSPHGNPRRRFPSPRSRSIGSIRSHRGPRGRPVSRGILLVASFTLAFPLLITDPHVSMWSRNPIK